MVCDIKVKYGHKPSVGLDASSPVTGLNAAICPCQAPPLTPQKVSQRGGGPRSNPVSCSVTLTCMRHLLETVPVFTQTLASQTY